MNKILFLEEYDKAVIGIIDEMNPIRIVYSKKKMIDVLVSNGMDKLEAVDHLEYNVWGAYKGDYTPVYLNDLIGTSVQDILDYI